MFVDYNKAFETLDHNILLDKLITYDFGKNAIAWIKSYLGNRQHTVKCKDACSAPASVNYGVPQGSGLGPFCFIMYVDDLITHILHNTSAHIIMYADDTVLMTESDNPIEVVEEMQEVLYQT